MRRHAESLIILSGAAPARGWRHPVPLVDVLRAAVAEVEDYTRIKVTATTNAALAGPAVGDVIHMIAELAENATIYSPPQTPVMISGSIVGQGFAVEIEDRGLGMSAAQRDLINAELDSPPAFDLTGSDQLGLFVAGQLAKRQNIRISLRASPYGGTTAIVLIPRSLVVPEGTPGADASPLGDAPPLPAGGSAQALARHAIGSGLEPAGADMGQPSPSGHPGPSVPVGAAGLHAEPEPASSWLETASRWPESSPSAASEGLDWRPRAQPGDSTVGRPAEFTPLHAGGNGPGGSNGPGGLISVTPEGITGTNPAEGELPRRVRQASLAPQLRSSPPRPAPTADFDAIPERLPGEIRGERSPEETRVTMSAIQRGWERGRSVFDPSGSNGDPPSGPLAGAVAPDAPDAPDAADIEAMSSHTTDAVAGTDAVPGTDAGRTRPRHGRRPGHGRGPRHGRRADQRRHGRGDAQQ